ncbi:MAG: cysteine desulfurase [Bacteroidia bacterium]|nr:cysteine desulfurase [Bacteroidia bacterium]
MNKIETSDKIKTRVFDVNNIRKDFPILSTKINGHPLVYLDNAATSQKPLSVINSIVEYYSSTNANIHRGVHHLSQKASQEYDDTREKVQAFINARSEKEIVFTAGTTNSINLVASSFGGIHINEGDEVIVTGVEHHANIVPWQMLCSAKKANLKVLPINDDGVLEVSKLKGLINSKTKLLAFVYVSNALGTINPAKEIITIAHDNNVKVLLDAAQAITHFPVDVQELDCDFMAFSGHKMLGPTGVGVLYGKQELLEEMPPYMGGGDMISSVSFEGTTYNEVPIKFEAGTPNVEAVIAFGAAIDYWNSLDREGAIDHEKKLIDHAYQKLSEIPHLKIWGPSENRTAVVSFTIDKVNAMDVGLYLDTMGIAVRTGQHCTEPLMDRLGIPGTIRASVMFYNTMDEIDKMVDGVKKAIDLLRR